MITPRKSGIAMYATPRRSYVTDTSTVPDLPKRKLEIGDHVYVDIKSERYTGVLRYLGPVHFVEGEFAGLELTGESSGKGRNDGSVNGQQYFACEPMHGIFCPAAKVMQASNTPARDATARPQSAMSGRSGRSSVTDDSRRPPSVTPHKPRPSLSRPPSTTPGQARHWTRPSSSMAAQTPKSTAPRLLPRKSYADGIADEEGRRRAKTSAEEAIKAEKQIAEDTKGFRLKNMGAKEWQARRMNVASTPKPSPSTTSPLKESLFGHPARQHSLSATPKPKQSTTSNMPTPKAAKGRLSIFSQRSNRMSPPGQNGLFTETQRSSTATQALDRRDSLLQNLDLGSVGTHSKHTSDQTESSTFEDDQVFASAYSVNTESSEAHAVVPLSLYEESNLEIARLKAQLAEDKQAATAAQKVVLERAQVKAQENARRDMEEERRVERDDEQRRRKLELQEVETKSKEANDALRKELRKAQDELARVRQEHDKAVSEHHVELNDTRALMEKLKSSFDDASGTQANMQTKELEINQLKDRIERLEQGHEQEKADMLKEIDDLKDAGQEALDIFDKEQNASNAQIADLTSKMHALEARAQEAIADAVRERDAAFAGQKSDAAEIDLHSLQEQLTRAQDRIACLEDQCNEANDLLLSEREEQAKRKERYVENEKKFKDEISKHKARTRDLEQSQRDAQHRIDELHDALNESRRALESERAELEGLRDEAMIAGGGPDISTMQTAEHTKLKAEIDRLESLLEGARSGKREALRRSEERQKEVDELHGLLNEARSQIMAVKHDNSSLMSLSVPRTSQDSQRSSPRQDTFSPADEGASPALSNNFFSPASNVSDKRFSTTSTQSRRSYGSISVNGTIQHTSAEALQREMTGLRSIINTLNHELTEAKIASKQQERDLQAQIEKYQAEVESGESTNGHGENASAHIMGKLRNAEKEIGMLKNQLCDVQRVKDEQIDKLVKDVDSLEHLCEAHVWRMEEKDARVQELERKVGKLQRRLDRIQQEGSNEGGNGATTVKSSSQPGEASMQHGIGLSKAHPDGVSLPSDTAASSPLRTTNKVSSDSTPNASAAPSYDAAAVNSVAPSSISSTHLQCVECNETGHVIDDCPYLNDDVLF